jgi:hypothetical protein
LLNISMSAFVENIKSSIVLAVNSATQEDLDVRHYGGGGGGGGGGGSSSSSSSSSGSSRASKQRSFMRDSNVSYVRRREKLHQHITGTESKLSVSKSHYD